MICLETCTNRDAQVCNHTEWTRLPCSHAFHTMCILRSYTYTPSCPVCRGCRVVKENEDVTGDRTIFATLQTDTDNELQSATALWRRANRSYRSKLYRLEQRDAVAMRHKMDCERTGKVAVRSQDAYESLCAERREAFMQGLLADDEVVEARTDMRRRRRSHVRYERIRRRYAERLLGPPPSAPAADLQFGDFVASRRQRLSALIANALNAAMTENRDEAATLHVATI